jgi:hypothetical protein
MSNENKSPMTLVSVARTTEGIDDKNRKKLALKLTPDNAAQLVAAVAGLEGKDIMIDIRTGKQTQGSTGLQFPTSFIMVREHVPGKNPFAGNQGANTNYSKGTFKPKTTVSSSAAVSQAKRLAESE